MDLLSFIPLKVYIWNELLIISELVKCQNWKRNARETMREWWNGGKCSRKGLIPIKICYSSVSTKESHPQCAAKSGPNSHTYSIASKVEILVTLECWPRTHYMKMIFYLMFIVLLGIILNQSWRLRYIMYWKHFRINFPESDIAKAWTS